MKKTIEEWAKIYTERTDVGVNLNSMRKRRKIAGLGEWHPPSKYLLTEEEFYSVLRTPLPMCSKVTTHYPFVRLN